MGEVSNGLLFLLGFLAARLLGPSAFGQYHTAFSFVGLFRILPDFGMAYASTLAISRDRTVATRLTGSLIGFQGLLSAATIALCLGVGSIQYDGVTWLAVIVLTADLVLKSLKGTLRWVLKALERFGAEAVSLVAERVLLLALGYFVLKAGHGVVGFVLAFLVVRAIDTTALYAWVHARVLPPLPRAEPAVWWDLLKKGLPFAYAGAMITLIFQVDAVILEKLRGAREVGYYGAPVLVLTGLTLVPRILGYAVIPTMAALHGREPDKIAELYGRGVKYLVVAGLPVAAFGILESDRFMALLFGPGYAPSAAASRVLLPAATFMFLSNFAETALACVNRWSTIVWVSTLALVVNVALNLLWIPSLGYMGSAWATLVTELTYLALSAGAMWRFGYRAGWARRTARPALAALVFAGVLWAARGLPLVAAAAAASLAFVAATFALGVWDAEERRLMRGLFTAGGGRSPDPAA